MNGTMAMGRMNTVPVALISAESSLSFKIEVPGDKRDYASITNPSEAVKTLLGPA